MDGQPQPIFTVFTPTHNRAHTLERVYNSLCQQTFRDFEWLVIDNESSDGTPQLINRWRSESQFPIRYIYKQNEGYATSYNLSLKEAKGIYMVEIASDDACVPHALERFLFHWNSIPDHELEQYATITALSADQHGRLHGQPFPQPVIDSNFCEMRYWHRVRGEKWGCQRLAVNRQYPHVRLDNGEYAVEGCTWRAIGKAYRTRYISEILHTFWVHGEQLTRSTPDSLAQRNIAWHQTVLHEDIAWFRYAPAEFVRSAMHFSRFAFHTGLSMYAQASWMRHPLARALWLIVLPLGWLIYRRDVWRAGHQPITQEIYGQQNNT